MANPSNEPRIAAARTLDSDPPRFTPGAAEQIALDYFGIEAQAESLDSERDQNFRLTSAAGPQYVLKIANAAEAPSAIEFENAILEHLHRVAPAIPVPRIVPSTANENVVVHASEGVNHLVRCLTWLDGTCLDDKKPKPRLHRQLGTELARLGRALRGLFHPAARKPLLWDVRNLAKLSPWLEDIDDRDMREFCAKFVRHFSEDTVPRLAALRSQVIYNDFHGDNIYVNDESPPTICGIGDFGDSLHGPLICDVAVASAYQVSTGEDPLEDVIELVNAYNRVTPLEPEELDLLPDLVMARLIASLTIASARARRFPENREYIVSDAKMMAEGIKALSRVPAEEASRRLREACGWRDHSGHSPAPLSDEHLETQRRLVFGSKFELFYDRPVNLVRGEGVWLYDGAGEAYLDAYNNVPVVGHCHPDVVDALSRQAATLNTHTRYLNDAVVEYADRLLSLFPDSLDRVMFSCTGSEANELAIRIARTCTGNQGIIVTRNAYHGNTSTLSRLSPEDSGEDAREVWKETIPAPDTYRRPDGSSGSDWVQDYLGEVDLAIERLRERGIRPAALLLDCAFISDGMFVPPPGLVSGAADRVRAAGGVVIADEVQSGFGRLGRAMWGFEVHQVEPELVTLGKPIGNGHPLAATVMQGAALDTFTKDQHYFNTFGGNPVASKVGLAVLKAFERDGLLRNARETGIYLNEHLLDLAELHDCIGDVRCSGLMAGIEIVSDRASKNPAADLTRSIVNRMRELRILISSEGPHQNVLKIRPPMPFAPSHVDRVVDGLNQAIGNIASRGPRT